MKKPDSLRVVLSVRLRAEENRERALAAACADVYVAEAALASLQEDHRTAVAAGLRDAGTLVHGADLQAREQRLASLRKACDLAREALAAKMSLRAEQQAAYLEARRGREVLDMLLKQRALAQQTEWQRRDTSRAEDLFLSRRARLEHVAADQV